MSHGSLLSTKEADLVRGEARHEHERRVARRRRQAQRARMQRAAPRQRLALLRRQRRRRDAHGREARARRRSSTTPDPPRRERHEAPQHGDRQPFWLLFFYRYRRYKLVPMMRLGEIVGPLSNILGLSESAFIEEFKDEHWKLEDNGTRN